ncbi:LptA/OstA family protein [candidate division KSB1 bacterium]
MLRHLLKYYIFAGVIGVSALDAYCQDVIRLISSESTSMQRTQNGMITTFKGPVHWFIPEEDMHIYCDETEVREYEDLYVLKGNVLIEDPDKTLQSELIEYSELSKIAYSPGAFVLRDSVGEMSAERGKFDYEKNIIRANGNVKYLSELRTLDADSMVYFQDEEKVLVFGNIRLFEFEQNAAGYGEYAEVLLDQDYGRLQGDPRIAIADTSDTDSLYIYGEELEYFGGDSSKFIVRNNARFIKGEIEAVCDSALYDSENEMIYLRLEPRIYYRSNRVIGDEIDLYLKDRELDKVLVSNNAVAYSPSDTTGTVKNDNELRGNTITLYFIDKIVNKVVASQNAESLYYIVQDGVLAGKHHVRGEQIIFNFVDGEFNSIVAENGVNGRYRTGGKIK